MSAHLFVDESVRGRYLLAALVLPPNDLARVRTMMRALRLPGERRVHFQAEGDSRRREVLSRLVQMDLEVCLYTGLGRNERVRAACLRSLIQDAAKLDAQRLLLESRGPALDRIDRRTIADALRVEVPGDRRSATGTGDTRWLTYEHLQAHEDPALWIPDAVAWSYGAGGHWRKRVSSLTSAIIDLGRV